MVDVNLTVIVMEKGLAKVVDLAERNAWVLLGVEPNKQNYRQRSTMF